MQVKIQAKGGFAGGIAEGERDYSDLSSTEREELDKLVSSGGEFAEHNSPTPWYEITITDQNGTQKRLKVPEGKMPKELKKIPEIKF